MSSCNFLIFNNSFTTEDRGEDKSFAEAGNWRYAQTSRFRNIMATILAEIDIIIVGSPGH